MEERTVIHLIRHGEVHNPNGTFYGRLPGFVLSADGKRMAERAGRWLAHRRVVRVVSSPLERARETAAFVAAPFGLEAFEDERLIEVRSIFEGSAPGTERGFARLKYLPHLHNPFRPSWGEPYREIARRMLAAITDLRAAVRGREGACVSHALPIWVARRALERRPLWHRPWRRQCALGSVTMLTFVGDELRGIEYAEPGEAS